MCVCVRRERPPTRDPPLGGGGGTALLFPPPSSIDFLPLLKHGVFLFLPLLPCQRLHLQLLLPAERRQHIALLSPLLTLTHAACLQDSRGGERDGERGAEGFNKARFGDHPSFVVNSAFSNQVYGLLLEKLVKSSSGKVAISPSFSLSPPPPPRCNASCSGEGGPPPLLISGSRSLFLSPDYTRDNSLFLLFFVSRHAGISRIPAPRCERFRSSGEEKKDVRRFKRSGILETRESSRGLLMVFSLSSESVET